MAHPDLVRLGRTLRNRLDDTLGAEQAAARRRRTLRDRLLDSEDRTEHVVLTTSDGQIHRGHVEAVGVDHVVVIDSPSERFIAINHIITEVAH